MKPEQVQELKSRGDALKERSFPMPPAKVCIDVSELDFLCESALRLSAIQQGGDEEVDTLYRHIVHGSKFNRTKLVEDANELREIAKSRGQENKQAWEERTFHAEEALRIARENRELRELIRRQSRGRISVAEEKRITEILESEARDDAEATESDTKHEAANLSGSLRRDCGRSGLHER